MTIALCAVSGLLKNLIDNLGGKNGLEWTGSLTKFLRRENPFNDETITYALSLTPSIQAGLVALRELCDQNLTETHVWHRVEIDPIEQVGNYSTVHRSMRFILEDGGQVEVTVVTFIRGMEDIVDSDEDRDWEPCSVLIEGGDRMRCYLDSHRAAEVHPWTRWPDDDQPMSDQEWREPSQDELHEIQQAAADRNVDHFTALYLTSGIDWSGAFKSQFGRDTTWAREQVVEAKV